MDKIICECGNEKFNFYGRYVICIKCKSIIQKGSVFVMISIWDKKLKKNMPWRKLKASTEH